MTADRRRSPLGGFAARFDALSAGSGGRLRIVERPYLRQLDVRAGADDRDAARAAIGVELPTAPNQVVQVGDHAALWLGPDEWLVVGGDQRLPDVPESTGWGVVDVSAQRTALVLTGPAVLGLLAHGCALDLERIGDQDWCAQTTLARAGVILWGTAPDEIVVLVRASFAAYLASWLLDAAAELVS